MSLSNFPNLTKSITTAFEISPPTSTLSTTYGPTWNQVGSSFQGLTGDNVGVTIGMSNDGLTIAFTSPGDDAGGTNRGSVKVYRWINSVWTLLGNPFYGLVNNETFGGISLGYDGNTIAINYTEAAQSTTNTSKKGFCAVFYYNPSKPSGSNDVTNALFGPIGWSILGGVIYNEGNGDNAVAVKLSGNNKTIAIGVPNNDGTSGNINDQRGSVRVYSYDATKTTEVTDQSNSNFGPIGWTRIGQDIDGLNALDNFGAPLEISVDGGIIVVGCPGADDLPSIMFGERLGQTNFGHAKVLYWTGSTWAQRGRNMYPQLHSIYDSNMLYPSSMGISSNGNIVALGNAPFRSYGGITSTWIWNATSSDYMPLASQVQDFFDWQGSGRATLNSDGTVMAVGANDADNNTSNGGTLRVYKLTTKSTTLISTTPSNMSAYISDIDFGGMTANGTIYRVTITGAVSGGTVWGTNIYRHDSNLAMAAVHAGVVANGETKEVFVVMERPQVYYFNTTRLGITSSSYGPESSSYPMGSYGAYFFQTTPRYWLKIGNDIFGAANEYLGTNCLLSSDGTRVITGSTIISGGNGAVKIYSINSFGQFSYTSSNPSVVDVKGFIAVPLTSGQTTITATQSASGGTPQSTITATLIIQGNPALAFVNPPTTKILTDATFTLTTSSASSVSVTYTSSNTSLATVGLTTGLVTLKGIGTVTITAAQVESAQYMPASTTCSIAISSVGSTLAGQTIQSGTSFSDLNLSGASFVGTTLSGVSFSGATLTNVDFSGATITGTDFTNANISGATNLPAFSTAQKLQLLSNINNVAIGEIQINTQLSGADINAILPAPIPAIATATFILRVPTTLDASLNKVLTITSIDLSNNASVYIPLNVNESISINGTVFSFNGTNILDTSNNARSFLLVEGSLFKLYAGSIIALNISEPFNEFKIMDNRIYTIFSALFKPRSA